MFKKVGLPVVLGSLLVGTLATTAAAQPMRPAREVANVASPYAFQWVVRPSEERWGDQTVTNAPECDIGAVSAANDRRRLRVDIKLHSPITFRRKILYGVKILFKGGVAEGYVYAPTARRLMYLKWRGGALVERKVLPQFAGSDQAAITATLRRGRRLPNTLVSVFIDKDKHFSRLGRGRRKFVTAQFFSGFISRASGTLREADRTIPVRISYIR